MAVSPSVINKIKWVLFTKEEPPTSGVVWAKPEGDSFIFYAYDNGAWTDIAGTSGVIIPSVSAYLSAFINDAGFLVAADLFNYTTSDDVASAISTALTSYYTYSEVNTLLNGKQDTINDLSEIRSGAAAGATAYQKPQNGIPAADIASGVIPDVTNFITNSVNNLTNYYLKSETYTKAEVESLISAINQFHYEIYGSTSAVVSPADNVLYLIGPTMGSGSDRYEEYVYVNSDGGGFVKIGDTSIDLSGYVTTSALNTALADYTTTANISGKEDKSNKVTSLSAQSTDTQYPSAKAVYDNLPTTMGASGSSHAGGLVPDTPSTAGTTKFLREDGTWQVPAGGGGDVSGKADKVSGATNGNFAALDSNGNLTDSGHKHSDYLTSHQDISGKEDVTTIVAPVNATDATLPITSLTTEVGKYYRLDVPVETLAVTLPAMTDTPVGKAVVLFLTGGTAPAVTITSTAPSGGTAPAVHFVDGFEIKAGKTNEVNCYWNGLAWIVASVKIIISNS